MWELTWRTSAVRDLVELGRRDQRQARQILAALHRFEQTGTGDLQTLTGAQRQFRLRVGDWRVLMRRTTETAHAAQVLEIRNRRDAYD